MRKLLLDTERTSRELAIESRIDSCLAVIRMLEGKSGLIYTNVPNRNHATAFQTIPKEQARACDQFPPRACLTRRLEDSSINRTYGFNYEGVNYDAYAFYGYEVNPNPPLSVHEPFIRHDVDANAAFHTKLPEAIVGPEWGIFSNANAINYIQTGSSILPGPLNPSDLGTLEMLERGAPSISGSIDPDDDAAWEVFLRNFEWEKAFWG